MATNYFEDPGFQEALLTHLVRDRAFLRQHASMLKADDFKPVDGDPDAKDRWIIATKALAHWQKYSDPIQDLLTAELRKHCKDARLGQKRTLQLLRLGKTLTKRPLKGGIAVSDKLVEFKTHTLITQALDELVTLHGQGELTHQKFLEMAREVVSFDEGAKMVIRDYFETLEDRISRRKHGGGDDRYPVFFIDPLDAITRGIAKGHLGCITAPYKRGKSLMLIWIAIAYVIQRMNVLYITLEDPQDDVEDRFDAAVANLPIKRLVNKPKTLRLRFAQFRKIVRGRLKIIDAGDEGMTVGDIEALYLEQKEEGFIADAVIVDYDDEIRAKKKNQDRRFEFAEIYRDLRRFAAKHHLLLWTAAQTQRNTADMKMISADKLAEDISKARKVACMLTLGKGDWGPDSIYINVAAHKYNRQDIGCTIFANKENMLIYDRARTLAETKRLAAKAKAKAAKGGKP